MVSGRGGRVTSGGRLHICRLAFNLDRRRLQRGRDTRGDTYRGAALGHEEGAGELRLLGRAYIIIIEAR